jgi:hypothetical protein|tara:strand:- start:1165 stop:1584 length:420 start_codon:yes stop_codon:yes gene_type:complete
MYHSYFEDWEVKEEFTKEFVSLWDGWLGEESYKLDLVTENDWNRFNEFIKSISQNYEIKLVNCNNEELLDINNIQDTLSNYEESMNKDYSLFSKYILPDLNCVITEEWDYTYIIWHKNNGAVEVLSPLIEKAKLKHFVN